MNQKKHTKCIHKRNAKRNMNAAATERIKNVCDRRAVKIKSMNYEQMMMMMLVMEMTRMME